MPWWGFLIVRLVMFALGGLVQQQGGSAMADVTGFTLMGAAAVGDVIQPDVNPGKKK